MAYKDHIINATFSSRKVSEGRKRNRMATVVIIGLMLLSLVPLQPGLGAAGEKITVRSPNGGEVLVGGQMVPITWTAGSSGGFIHVSYSVDGGTTYTLISTEDNSGGPKPVFKWRVPFNVESTTCRIQLEWTDILGKGAVVWDEDESDADFTIGIDHWLQGLEVPDEMTYGKYYPIHWELFDPFDDIAVLDLEQTVYDGSAWTAWASAGTRYTDMLPEYTYAYYTPPNYNNSRGKVRLIARDSSGGTALRVIESAEFDIRSAIVTVVYPNGGEVLVHGDTVTIEWRVVQDPGELISGVAIHYTTNDGVAWPAITLSTENDYSYDWTVPTGGTSDRVRFRVTLYYLEFSVLGTDESDANNRIIESSDTLSVTLLDPNPPTNGNYIRGGYRHLIQWEATGSLAEITGFELFYSLNSGAGWTRIDQVVDTVNSYSWLVPRMDSDHGRIRVSLTTDAGRLSVISNNDIIFYTGTEYNTPPVAVAGEDWAVGSGASFRLDGTGSWDVNGDTLSYNWTIVDDLGYNVTLRNADTAEPAFQAFIGDENVTIVVQLRVDDGWPVDPIWPSYTDRLSVRVEARGPIIISFTPQHGWAGTPISIDASSAAGATFYLDAIPMYTVPRSHVEGDLINFTLHDTLPFGSYQIEIRNLAGSDLSTEELEVHPYPYWPEDFGLSDQNPTDHILTYPWLLWEEGSYKDTFGEGQVYFPYYVCIGIPWWDPWTGFSCLGYEFEESLAPDPLAMLYYGCFYCWIARYGECYGMSSTALQLYHNDANPAIWNESALYSRDLDLAEDSEFNRNVDKMQGSQLSAEVLEWYLYRFLEGLEPSAEFPMPAMGMGIFLRDVENAVRDHEYGIITMISGDIAHAVVPWKVVNVPYDNTVRIYVYDCNKPIWTSEEGVQESFNESEDYWHTPPYIEVDKTGGWWEWSYDFTSDIHESSTTGIAFIPYSVVNGPRTLPTDWEGMSMFLTGDATSSLEDTSGNRNYWDTSGNLIVEVPDSAPAPTFMGLGDHIDGWLIGNGTDFTTTVEGKPGDGVYNWSVFWNGTSAYAIQLADVKDTSTDTISMEYTDDNPLRGRMTYGTTDASKGYGFTHVKAMGAEGQDPKTRQRVYSVLDATLFGDSLAIINTTDDYASLVFQNRGPHKITIGVQFQGNVITEAQLNATGVPDHLPTATLMNIEIGPYEVVTFTPSDWLDLDNAEIIVSREIPEIVPPGQVASFNAVSQLGAVHMTWTPPEDDGGAVIDDYIIWRGPRYNELNQLTIVDGSERTYIDDSVEIGETYFYMIQAANVAGSGKDSPSIGVWVQQGPASPSPPASAEATVVKGEVRLTWDPPENDGGGKITGYQIFRADYEWQSTPDLITEVGDVTSFVDSKVEVNATYYYFIAAVNEAGGGATYGPIVVNIPADGNGGNGGNGGDDGDEGVGSYPLWEYAVAAVIMVGALGSGFVVGRQWK